MNRPNSRIHFHVVGSKINEELLEKLEYYSITKKSINILGVEYCVSGSTYNTVTKDEMYLLEPKKFCEKEYAELGWEEID